MIAAVWSVQPHGVDYTLTYGRHTAASLPGRRLTTSLNRGLAPTDG